MGLQVIGVGMHRTGTLSVKVALERLSIGPCYHGMEYLGRPDHEPFWRKARESDGDVGWAAFFANYRAAMDWPLLRFWDKVIAAHPEAKVLLTERDPGSWYDSHCGALQPMFASDAPRPRHLGLAELTSSAFLATFDGRPFDRDHAIEVFTQHYERVRDTVPADRLLNYRVEQGWEPLCRFLGVDVPSEPFPQVNARDALAVNFRLANGRSALETEGLAWQ